MIFGRMLWMTIRILPLRIRILICRMRNPISVRGRVAVRWSKRAKWRWGLCSRRLCRMFNGTSSLQLCILGSHAVHTRVRKKWIFAFGHRYLDFVINKVYVRYTSAPVFSAYRKAFLSKTTAMYKYEDFVSMPGKSSCLLHCPFDAMRWRMLCPNRSPESQNWWRSSSFLAGRAVLSF